MRIKRISTLVITISSLVIISVLGLTIFGFYAYLGWKVKVIRQNYRAALYDLNGRTFARYVTIDLQPGIGTDGALKGKPVVEGTLKNSSNKKIYSLKLKIAFYDSLRRAIYVDRFYPVGPALESPANAADVTENFLRENDSISFVQPLKNCPSKVLLFLKSKLGFAKINDKEPIDFEYKIEGMDIR